MTAWISWLHNAVVLASFSVALFNASKDDTAKRFAYVYALISVGVLVKKRFSFAVSALLIWITDIWICAIPIPYNDDSPQRSRALWYEMLCCFLSC